MMMQKLNASRVNTLRQLRQPMAYLVTAGFAFALPAPAQAGIFDWIDRSTNAYQTCAKELATAKIATDAAADACAKALHPDELSRCVTRTSTAKDVQVSAVEALSNCRQVRRPAELATCIVDIRQLTKDAPVADVLDTCRRSLLPISFSKCVVGLHKELKLAAKPSMDSCIDANFPRDFVSNLLPLDYTAPLPASPATQPGGFTPNTAPLPNIPTTPPGSTPPKEIRGLGG
jgi:hypothetical protein